VDFIRQVTVIWEKGGWGGEGRGGEVDKSFLGGGYQRESTDLRGGEADTSRKFVTQRISQTSRKIVRGGSSGGGGAEDNGTEGGGWENSFRAVPHGTASGGKKKKKKGNIEQEESDQKEKNIVAARQVGSCLEFEFSRHEQVASTVADPRLARKEGPGRQGAGCAFSSQEIADRA